MSSPLSIRLPDDLDAIVREQASVSSGTVTDVIVKALRRGVSINLTQFVKASKMFNGACRLLWIAWTRRNPAGPRRW
jgi:hypothetical protein